MFEYQLVANKYHLIKKFVSKHSHDLVTPQCAHYLKSHRRIEFSQLGLIDTMHSSGLKQSEIYSYMSVEAKEPQYLGFIRSDCNNMFQRKRAEFFKKGDSQCLLDYFKQKKPKKINTFSTLFGLMKKVKYVVFSFVTLS